jgi:superfamily II DNA or RNA helicase
MWSLYKRDENCSVEGANLFNYSGEKLDPLKFSNGKTQADVVKEIVESINQGSKIIFVKGVCGSGKSAMALNLARQFNKSSIVVPIKSLQEQYEKDYTQKKFILKEDGNPLNIAIIKGRNNFSCPFSGEKADDLNLPCTIEIRDKNSKRLLDYIRKNDNVNAEDF